MDDGMKISPLGFAIGTIIALAIGLGAGMYFSGQGAAQPAQGSSGLTLEDKNFMINVANLQIDQIVNATAQQSVLLDWCTAGGGQWFPLTQNSAVNVTSQQAQQLKDQGAN